MLPEVSLLDNDSIVFSMTFFVYFLAQQYVFLLDNLFLKVSSGFCCIYHYVTVDNRTEDNWSTVIHSWIS